MFVLNFVISGKVTSLPKVIKYVKRSKYSLKFHDLSAKHTPNATLTVVYRDEQWTFPPFTVILRFYLTHAYIDTDGFTQFLVSIFLLSGVITSTCNWSRKERVWFYFNDDGGLNNYSANPHIHKWWLWKHWFEPNNSCTVIKNFA